MDNFVEQLVAKRADGKAYFLRGLIVSFAVVMVALGIVATVMFAFPLLLFVSVGACYLAWWLFGNTSLEYEYIVTNNDFDIDKIIGKRKRKRMITVDISQAEDFAPYPPENEISADATVHAYTGSDVDAYYLLVNHSGYGRVKLIFNPNKKMREAIMQELPNTLRIKLRNNNVS